MKLAGIEIGKTYAVKLPQKAWPIPGEGPLRPPGRLGAFDGLLRHFDPTPQPMNIGDWGLVGAVERGVVVDVGVPGPAWKTRAGVAVEVRYETKRRFWDEVNDRPDFTVEPRTLRMLVHHSSVLDQYEVWQLRRDIECYEYAQVKDEIERQVFEEAEAANGGSLDDKGRAKARMEVVRRLSSRARG